MLFSVFQIFIQKSAKFCIFTKERGLILYVLIF